MKSGAVATMIDVPTTIDIRRHAKDVAIHVQRRVRGDLAGVRKDARDGAVALAQDAFADHDQGNEELKLFYILIKIVKIVKKNRWGG